MQSIFSALARMAAAATAALFLLASPLTPASAGELPVATSPSVEHFLDCLGLLFQHPDQHQAQCGGAGHEYFIPWAPGDRPPSPPPAPSCPSAAIDADPGVLLVDGHFDGPGAFIWKVTPPTCCGASYQGGALAVPVSCCPAGYQGGAMIWKVTPCCSSYQDDLTPSQVLPVICGCPGAYHQAPGQPGIGGLLPVCAFLEEDREIWSPGDLI